MSFFGSLQAVAGALIVLFGVREGPYAMPQSRFDPGQMLEMVRNKKLRLANLGYLGHMWELYSMWGWICRDLCRLRRLVAFEV